MIDSKKWKGKPWEQPRYEYTYKNKKEGNFYYVEYPLSCIINKEQGFMEMALNRLWEVVSVKRQPQWIPQN